MRATVLGHRRPAELRAGVRIWGAGCTDCKERRSSKLRERAYYVSGDHQAGLWDPKQRGAYTPALKPACLCHQPGSLGKTRGKEVPEMMSLTCWEPERHPETLGSPSDSSWVQAFCLDKVSKRSVRETWYSSMVEHLPHIHKALNRPPDFGLPLPALVRGHRCSQP